MFWLVCAGLLACDTQENQGRIVAKYTEIELLEAQLEDQIRQAPELIEPELVYLANQVPTRFGRLDMLLVDSGGALVIAELKVVEDNNMLAQGLDYYDHVVETIHAMALIQYAGRFDPAQPPRLLLIAPAFSELLLRRCRWVDVPISLFRYQAIQVAGTTSPTVVFSESMIPPRVQLSESATIATHLAYVTDEKLRDVAEQWLQRIKQVYGAALSVTATKSYVSVKLNGQTVGDLTPYRKKWLVSVRGEDGTWQHIAAVSKEAFADAVGAIERALIADVPSKAPPTSTDASPQ